MKQLETQFLRINMLNNFYVAFTISPENFYLYQLPLSLQSRSVE